MKAIGDKGEERARNFIEQKYNWQLLDKNWRNNRGEIDAIYYDKSNGTLHFIEVKHRSASLERALESITNRKLHRMWSSARAWLSQHGCSGAQCQFDVVVVSGESIEIRQNILN